MEKWIYRIEHKSKDNGLWYNDRKEFVYGIGEISNCESKELPMGLDDKYKQEGKNWYSGCPSKEVMRNWFTQENVYELLSKGFVLHKYLAVDYVDYEHEVIFIKETVLEKVSISVEDVYLKKVDYLKGKG